MGGGEGAPLPLPKAKGFTWRYAKPGELGPNEYGLTTKTGNVIIRRGMSAADEAITIRHEFRHWKLTPLGKDPLAVFRQNVGQGAYDRSVILRVIEEGFAQGRATRSLTEGIAFPFRGGYSLMPGWVDLVAGGAIVTTGYSGYEVAGSVYDWAVRPEGSQ